MTVLVGAVRWLRLRCTRRWLTWLNGGVNPRREPGPPTLNLILNDGGAGATALELAATASPRVNYRFRTAINGPIMSTVLTCLHS